MRSPGQPALGQEVLEGGNVWSLDTLLGGELT